MHPPGVPPPAALTRETLWFVAVWLLSWPSNMLGEELTWRAVVLPRMEAYFGQKAWLLNAALWLVFHLAFGPGNLLVLLPTLAIVPWVTQRRRNAWLGLVLHATLSLPGFIAMALGAA
jgi:membrane protease YdiL (CAAX protease family)